MEKLTGTIVGYMREGTAKIIIELTHGCANIPLDKEVEIIWKS